MLLHTRCSACGKVSTVPADAGDTLLCSACGTFMPTPHLPAPVLAQLRSRALYIPSTPLALATVAPAAAVAPTRPRRHRVARLAVVVSCLLLLGAMGGLLYLYPPTRRASPPAVDWEQAHRAGILSLKAQAEDLAISGQLPEAHEKYRQLEQLAVGQTLRDPTLAAVVDRARQQQDRVYAKLLAAGEAAYLRNLQARAATSPAIGPVPDGVARNTVPQTQPTSQPAVAQLPATAPIVSRWTDPATRPSPAGMPVLRRAPKPDLVSDAQVLAAIDKGLTYLRGQYQGGELTQTQGAQVSREVAEALCAYALLEVGQATHQPQLDAQSPFIKEVIEKLKSRPMGADVAGRALRIAALTALNRAEDRPVIQADLDALLRAANGGRFSGPDRAATSPATAPALVWDASTAEMGLLGVWLAAEAGFDVPAGFWVSAQEHWNNAQLASGQWPQGSAQSAPSFASTVAGLSASFITNDYVDAPSLGLTLDQPPYPPALARSLAFIEASDNSAKVLSGKVQYLGYNLWALERAGQGSGHKFFGAHNWYRRMAAGAVAGQFPNGAWGIKAEGPDSIIDTAYILVFLSRGRQGAILNKLRFDGAWANRPRDAANLARFIGRQMQRPLTWQIATLDRDWPDWIDAPILYLASHRAPRFKDEDLQKLRAFIDTGGLLFTQADGGDESFNRFAEDLARFLFPGQELRDLPQDHLLYTIAGKVDPRPPLKAVGNGSRLLMVHSPTDIASAWQSRAEKPQRAAFDLGLNLYVYAAGANDTRNRLASPYIPAPAGVPLNGVRVARLKYDGNWDPEPGGWARFARYFRWETDWQLDVSFVDLADLRPGMVAFAHLTAGAPFTPSPAELAAIKGYVEAGGVLLIEPTGRPEYLAPLRGALLGGPFRGIAPKALAVAHPLLAGPLQGMTDVSQPRLRRFALDKISPDNAAPEIVRLGKGCLILSSVDIGSGLLGTNTGGIVGYDADYAQELLKNMILWTADGARQ